MSDEDSDNETYFVEKIVNHRNTADSGLQFFVKWHGYANTENTWIPESDLNDGHLKDIYLEKHLPGHLAALRLEEQKKDPDFEDPEASEEEKEKEEEEEEAGDEETYYVEKIVDHRREKGKGSKLEFLVQWFNFDEPTWIPEDDLNDGKMKDDYVKEFLPHEVKKKKAVKKSKSSTPKKSKSMPKVLVRVLNAIKALNGKDRLGTSRQAVYNWIAKNYAGTLQRSARNALTEGVKLGLWNQLSTSRFKITNKGKEYEAPKKGTPKKKTPKKKAKAKKVTPKKKKQKKKAPKRKSKKKEEWDFPSDSDGEEEEDLSSRPFPQRSRRGRKIKLTPKMRPQSPSPSKSPSPPPKKRNKKSPAKKNKSKSPVRRSKRIAKKENEEEEDEVEEEEEEEVEEEEEEVEPEEKAPRRSARNAKKRKASPVKKKPAKKRKASPVKKKPAKKRKKSPKKPPTPTRKNRPRKAKSNHSVVKTKAPRRSKRKKR